MSRLRLVVLGTMGRMPFGGHTWVCMNWLHGLAQLGHDVYYVEDDSVWPYDPIRNAVSDDFTYAAWHIDRCMRRIDLDGRWALRFAHGDWACYGRSARAIAELYRSCDALLNLPGATELHEDHLLASLRVYLQTDPVTCELRLAQGDEHTHAVFSNHHVIATYGENYGGSDCAVPLNGNNYVNTRQPIALDMWPAAYDRDARYFTTIGNYRQEGGDVAFAGEVYSWSKHDQFERFIDLPRRTAQRFHLAMRVKDPGDMSLLLEHGWEVSSPLEMSLDPFGSYPEFIRRSRAEFTVAKDQNVRLRSGWFSDRDACYLASGKPVVAQDTGFGRVLPTGEGLFAFTTTDEALAAIAAINGDYRRHCTAARALAQEFFDAPKVAGRLLAALGIT